MKNFVYILLGAKYTRGRAPCKLVYFEVFDEKNDALKREFAIKKLSKSEKEKIVAKMGLEE